MDSLSAPAMACDRDPPQVAAPLRTEIRTIQIMARIEVPMPQMGESIAEGTVSTWLKRVGDRVERDEPIMEISTDKVDAEIPSPAAGTLTEILVQEGETVEVGTVVAFLESDGAGSGSLTASDSATENPANTTAELPVSGAATPEDEAAAERRSERALAPVQDRPAGQSTVQEPEPESAPAPATLAERIRTRSSPLVRRMAAEHGIDIRRIRGSGWMGRVTKQDVLAYLRDGGVVEKNGRGLNWDAFYTQVEHPGVEAGPDDRVEPMSRMTQLIADHMVLSQRITPHAHSYIEVDYSRVDQLRTLHGERWKSQGVRVSYTAFIARAVALALREHPKLNASVSGTDIIYRKAVNIGVAVALPQGLIVPVVKGADELSLVGMANRINDLAERARGKKLAPEEVQGGTFTITNPGIFGTVIGFPIVNQPQVAILCVGGIEKRPVVVTDEFGNDAIVARRRGFISLGFDHRLVNGADADRFLARIRELLQTVPEPSQEW